MTLSPIAQLFGAPNGWQLGSDGKLVRDRETEAYKAAVGYVSRSVRGGSLRS